MTHRPIMDAGPGLNFFSLNQEKLLFASIGAISIPECVQDEITRKSQMDQRFSAAEHVLRKLPSSLLEVLSDEASDSLVAAVSRISGMEYATRILRRQDLGEVMVVAHAAVRAESGEDVVVLIDDDGGRQIAAKESRRLERMKKNGQSVGSIQLLSTLTVLEIASIQGILPDKAALQKLYRRLRALDDGLVPIKNTGLLDLDCWSRAPGNT